MRQGVVCRLLGWRRLRDCCRSSRPGSPVMSRTKLPSCSAVGINWQNKEGRRGRQATTFRRKCNKLHQSGFTTAEECTGWVQRTFPGPPRPTRLWHFNMSSVSAWSSVLQKSRQRPGFAEHPGTVNTRGCGRCRLQHHLHLDSTDCLRLSLRKYINSLISFQ